MKRLLYRIYSFFAERRKARIWKQRNTHNHAKLGDVRDIGCVEIGKGTYGTVNAELTRSEAKLKIGSYCSIGKNVRFIPCADHPTNLLSTYPFRTFLGNNADAISKGDIIVEDDVWIGYGAVILSGVRIGQGAVVAAGAVVASDIPAYAVAGGVPAKVLKMRFPEKTVAFLKTLDFSRLEEAEIREHLETLYTTLEKCDENQLEQTFSWFPKKK